MAARMSVTKQLAPGIPAWPSARPRELSVAHGLGIALIAPMLLSGLVFKTYDIAMESLTLEMLRQFNAPFIIAEMLCIAWAVRRGFSLRATWSRLDKSARTGFSVFLASFWIGGVFVSQAAPFATLFNLGYLVHAAFLAAIAHLSVTWKPGDTASFARIVVIGLAGFAAMIAIRFLMPPTGRDIATIQWQFAIPGFISVRLFGAMAAPWAAFVLFLAVAKGDQPALRSWIYAACAITTAMVVWSGTRAAVLGVGTAGLVALAYRPSIGMSALGRTCAAVLCGIVVAIALLPYSDTDFWLFLPSDVSGGADALAGGRLALWTACWNAFQQVLPFGAGPGASAWILPAGVAKHIQPHNLVLEFLLNWGIIAATAAVFLLAKIVVAAHRRAYRAPAGIPFLLAADCLLAIGLFDGTFHFGQHLMLWSAMMGVALGVPEGAPTDSPVMPDATRRFGPSRRPKT